MRPTERAGLAVIVTCEHAGNRVPARWRDGFDRAGRILDSHRGYDRGALPLARALARRLDAALCFSTVSRLVVDLNRSEGHPAIFSRFVPRRDSVRQLILNTCHRPYRRRVHELVDARLAAGELVLHLSVHSFTPRLAGKTRRADIGLLYDPARSPERALCSAWQRELARQPGVRVRRNYPYRGTSDGLTTHLRRCYSARAYVGIEIELNQRHAARVARWAELLETTLRTALATS